MSELPPERSWVAGVPWSQDDSFRGRLSKHGGDLVMTDGMLFFEPLTAATIGGGAQGHVLEFLRGMRALELASIESVEPFSEKGPPRLRIKLRDGESVVLAVMPKRMATMWSKDTSARDDAIAAIRAAIDQTAR